MWGREPTGGSLCGSLAARPRVGLSCLSLWERWLSAAKTERATLGWKTLSVTCGDSSPRGRAKGCRVGRSHRTCSRRESRGAGEPGPLYRGLAEKMERIAADTLHFSRWHVRREKYLSRSDVWKRASPQGAGPFLRQSAVRGPSGIAGGAACHRAASRHGAFLAPMFLGTLGRNSFTGA